jgi:hypothetical protein
LQSDKIEFDVFFGRIPNNKTGREVTINWKSHHLKHGNTFYTDSNSYKMVRRQSPSNLNNIKV